MRTILIVEDDADTRMVLSLLLELKGYRPLVADCGARALTIARREPVDVALIDLGLPDIEGTEVARSFRQLDPPPLIVAVSGWAREQDRKAAIAAGFDAFLTKPVAFEAIERVMSRRRTGEPS